MGKHESRSVTAMCAGAAQLLRTTDDQGMGHTLAPNGLNCTTGGEAGKSLSMETRQNISKALKRYYENHANPQKGLVVVEAQGCVSLRKDSGKFQAIIPKSWNNGKNKCLGLFVTEEEAWAAIAEYKAEHVGS